MPIARKSHHHHQCRRPRCPVTANFLDRGGAIADSGRRGGRREIGTLERKCPCIVWTFFSLFWGNCVLQRLSLSSCWVIINIIFSFDRRRGGGVSISSLDRTSHLANNDTCTQSMFPHVIGYTQWLEQRRFSFIIQPHSAFSRRGGKKSRCQKRWTNIKKWAFSLHLSGW